MVSGTFKARKEKIPYMIILYFRNFDARALFATMICLVSVEAIARRSQRRGAQAEEDSEAYGGENEGDFDAEEEAGRHPMWLAFVSYGFSAMGYGVVWVTFGNKTVAVCLCLLLCVTARRMFGLPSAEILGGVIDADDDISAFDTIPKVRN